MKVSDYIANFLVSHGCSHVFGYQGGAVTHLIDSFYRCDDLTFIGTYHEQAAAFAAEGYARMRNTIGVATATSGPGATNLITGIGSAYFDSIPCLYLTGQVNTYEYKGDWKVRQLGFQETDIVSIVKPITKYAKRVTNASGIRYELEKALAIAASGRKGPVLLDIPMDIQRAEIQEEWLPEYRNSPIEKKAFDIDSIVSLIEKSKRPVILAGGGVRLANAADMLKVLCEGLRIPVVTSLMGRDAVDNSAEYYMGMIGAYGNRYANLTIANSDLIIALGTRLDTRQTGTRPESFAREAKLIRVDLDPNELERKVKADEYGIEADISEFLTTLTAKKPKISADTSSWLDKAKDYKNRYPTKMEDSLRDPNKLISEISKLLEPEDVICLDVGQNQMWGAQSLNLTGNQRLLTSGGMGSMGFSLPCAIGAYYSGVKGTIFAFTGDGGMQMNLQELELVKRNRIPIKIIVLNNQSLGMIRHFQEMYFESRYNGTLIDYQAPDFCRLAEAYGIHHLKIEGDMELQPLKEVFRTEEPAVIEIMLPEMTYVYPKLSVNHPIEDQDPLLSREEFSAQMIVKPYDLQESNGETAAKEEL
ncbi:thiamine pyrophosphate-binding protein [Sinanaerobacter chloroacetimidivorans]|uniref:Thiamine pyrophosphate-binding protein n=1 Tax=Sinanaerobacter chloroacetimidivorans TaxID=2818044 RepID=A0A8J7W3Q0_9FIRM|nr:thiamine pyrophosphate-binding protein [Sinanaerobacter chloroacetimidivorans]MBR0598680.1 thiamine pyrophosphate-binding protein [Sinanaerobacter chloroacetimidivorans]